MECCLYDYPEYCNDDHAANMYWIGLWKLGALNTSASLETRRKGWMWLDGSPYIWTNWYESEPRGKFRTAVMMNHGKWKEQDPNVLSQSICEKGLFHILKTLFPSICGCGAVCHEFS